MKEWHLPIKQFYRRHFKRFPAFRTAVMWGKSVLWRISQGPHRRSGWKHESNHFPVVGRTPKIAVLCDELTWANFKAETDAVYLHPDNWRQTFEEYRPDLFFCEAAWTGLEKDWEGRIFHDRTIAVDNRFILRDILRCCKDANIPTVFWNKEDIPEFSDGPDSFIDTAFLFDHIFTTAQECIPLYQAKGHPSVHLMMFGCSESLFPPQPLPAERGSAVFLGSWYEKKPERCRETIQIFDWVLQQGLKLDIYDRLSARQDPERQYPEQYRPYLHDGVPYEETWKAMAKAEYVININSVKNSQTMFARRVFEAMACGRMIISNDSLGLRTLFPGRIWFVGETPPKASSEEIIRENRKTVKETYTFKKQLFTALQSAGLWSAQAD